MYTVAYFLFRPAFKRRQVRLIGLCEKPNLFGCAASEISHCHFILAHKVTLV